MTRILPILLAAAVLWACGDDSDETYRPEDAGPDAAYGADGDGGTVTYLIPDAAVDAGPGWVPHLCTPAECPFDTAEDAGTE